MKKILLSIAVFGFMSCTVASAQAPQWWSDRGVIDPLASPNDFGPVNQGQVKNIVSQAHWELQENLPGGAGAEVQALISSWNDAAPETNDFAPANLGQIKNVAQPVFSRLIAGGYRSNYPWEGSANPSNDYALANVGQVKELFSFDLTAGASGDGLPDWWELYYFGDLNQSASDPAPGDPSLTLGEALPLGRDPTAAAVSEATAGEGTVGLEVYTNL